MIPKNLGGYKSIDKYVVSKSNKLRQSERSFDALFEFMFSERENVLWEQSRGYRIEKITYGDAYDQVKALAPKISAVLSENPTTEKQDEIVGLCLDNSLEWIVSLWAILASGANVLLINPRLGEPVLEKTLRENNIKVVFTNEHDSPFKSDKTYDFNLINIETLPETFEKYTKKPFGGEILVMSSGTSAHVKCCAYGASEIIDQVLDSTRIIKECKTLKKHFNGELKLLCLLPFCHIFGLTAVYMWFAFFSRTFVKLNDLSPRTVQNTIKRHKVTHVFAVPLFWQKTYGAAMQGIADRGDATVKKFEKGLKISRALDNIPAFGRLFSKLAFKEVRDEIFGQSISYFICGGSAVPPETLEFFNRIGYPISNGFGMSEIGITSVELRAPVRMKNPLSIGLPMSSIRYGVSDDGHLVVSGTSLARYIICDGVKSPLPEKFDTRDLVDYDKEGNVYKILGRADDLVIGLSGENLNPTLIESQFKDSGADVCLCSVQSNDRKSPVLVVSFGPYLNADNCRKTADAIKEKLTELGLNTQIEKLIYTREPLLGEEDFKLNRRLIAERVAAGQMKETEFNSADFVAADEKLYNIVRCAFGEALKKAPDTINEYADFFTDLGGSSFEWYAMTSALEEATGVKLPSSPAGISTICGLYECLEGRLGKNSQ